MKDNYKIVLSISRHNISYEYLRIGGGDALQPLARQLWPQPLAFFCQPDGNIVIGNEALYAVRAGTNNSYGDYFDNLGKNLTYTICGKDKLLNYLLLDASELLFADFFSSVLYNNLGPLDNNRRTMPLTIVCESDLDNNERAYIKELFGNVGYARLVVAQYDQFVEDYTKAFLSKQYDCSHLLSVFCNGDDMTLTLIDAVNDTERVQRRFPMLGIDPRVDYMSEQLWSAVSYQNPFLNKDEEWQIIQETAKDFLNSGDPQWRDKIRLSDGCEYDYNLFQISFNVSFEQDRLIAVAITDFLAQYGIRDRNQVLLLLRGNAADNDYFNSILRRGFEYNKVKSSDKKFVDEINKLIIAIKHPDPDVVPPPPPPKPNGQGVSDGRDEPVIQPTLTSDHSAVTQRQSSPNEVKTLNREWRELRASVNGMLANKRHNDARADVLKFLDKCMTMNFVDLISQAESLLASIPSMSDVSTESVGSDLKREWRMVGVGAKAKIREKRFDEARSELEHFLKLCKEAGLKDLEAKVVEVIATIPCGNSQRKVSSAPVEANSHKMPDAKQKKPEDELDKLIKERKLTDARDLCRKRGDEAMTAILTKIIRSQRSIDQRHRTLDECRRLKNKSQIENIIKEIDEHIQLCNSINVPCEEEKRLRKDYKSIK